MWEKEEGHRVDNLVPTIRLPCLLLLNLCHSILLSPQMSNWEVPSNEESEEEIPGCHVPVKVPRGTETPSS